MNKIILREDSRDKVFKKMFGQVVTLPDEYNADSSLPDDVQPIGDTRFKKGHKPWNIGTKGLIKSWNKGQKMKEYSRLKMIATKLANPTRYWLGKKRNPETIKKMVENRKNWKVWNKGLKGYKSGEKSNFWKGGVLKENIKARNTFEIKEWKKRVLERDDFTCQRCGKRGGELEINHDLSFSLFPDLRTELLNGETLCKRCHATRDSSNKGWIISQYNFYKNIHAKD